MDTYARVDLAVLGRNLTAIRALARRPVLLAVKANAYGHGLVEVAAHVADHHLADWLGVATVAEGVAVRQAGITLPILKLSPAHPDEVADAVAHHLTLTVIDAPTASAAEQASAAARTTTDVHLKIDTGMRRIGVEPDDAAALAATVEASPHLRLTGLFTHLAAADDDEEDQYTQRQLAAFDHAVAAIHDRLGRRVDLVHAANSAAILRHPAALYDLVRTGIMAYGYPPCTAPVPFEPVLSLVSHVSYVKTIRRGETVSYGRTWTAQRTTRLATIPIGYGDGYTRGLSNRTAVLIGGQRYPQVGTICMDQCMVDLGPDSTIAVGDQVTLIGRDGGRFIDADHLALLTDTIPYEILTGVSHRVPRVYVA